MKEMNDWTLLTAVMVEMFSPKHQEVNRAWQDRYILACEEKTVSLWHSGEEADAEQAWLTFISAVFKNSGVYD